MAKDNFDLDWIDLSEAIDALRAALMTAWWDSRGQRIRFKLEPVELTVQVGVTRSGKGSAGIRWQVLSLGAERSRQSTATQTLRLRLSPMFFDAHGKLLAEQDQLIAGQDDKIDMGIGDAPLHEPE
jgi:hypothetical protein